MGLWFSVLLLEVAEAIGAGDIGALHGRGLV
jgi:hypothetical protein